MLSITTTAVLRLFADGSIILTNFRIIRLRRYYPHEGKRRCYRTSVKKNLISYVSHTTSERDKAILNLLWYLGMRVSEIANVTAKDFNWEEGTVIVLGKGNRYRKALAGNRTVRDWFNKHNSFDTTTLGIQTMLVRLGKSKGIKCNAHSFRHGFCVHNVKYVKSGLSNIMIQNLSGWETPDIVSHYAQSLTFEEALALYKSINSSTKEQPKGY